MAPFVELEWGAAGTALMREIKQLFDPRGLLNPGVILSDDPEAHLKHLKPLPPAHALVDKCIECGFCEPMCPSAGLTLSPRQRITSWREITRRSAAGEADGELRALYDYAGIDTCAACGLCATVCPVGIETGKLIKALRGEQVGPLAARIGASVGRNYGATTQAVRLGLNVADAHARRRSAPRRCRRSPAARAACPAIASRSGRRRCRAARTGNRRRRRTAASASSTSRAARRGRWDRRAATTSRISPRSPSACCDGPATTSSIRPGSTPSAAASRSTARDTRRPRTRRRGARGRAARGERRRPAADRVRHQPVRLPDEAGAAGPAAGVRPRRIPARPRAAAADDPAGGRAGGRASGLQHPQDGPRVEARGRRQGLRHAE